jgi:hypothetical protein
MYTDEQVPRELERYLQQARKMRSEYLAGLVRQGLGALSRALRKAIRSDDTAARPSAKHTLAEH